MARPGDCATAGGRVWCGRAGVVPGHHSARRLFIASIRHRGHGGQMKPIDEDVPAMCRAHERGDVEAVCKLVEARPELERLAPDSTWLHRAAAAGQPAVIDFWLDRGWDVNLNLYEGS